MSSQNTFVRYLLILMVLTFASSLFLPRYYNIPYPKPLGMEFDPVIKKKPINAISEEKPNVVLIGDSVLFVGVDHEKLPQLLGVKTYSIAYPGAGSSIWYLALKNVVLEAAHTPKYVVIVFRDTKLTLPALHTTGPYFEALDDFAGRNEPLVTKLAYINQMSPIEKFAEQYLPIYSARWEIRRALDAHVRYTAPAALNCPAPCVNTALDSVFGKNTMEITAFNRGVENLYAPEFLNFEKQVEKSFLPHMIQLAGENEIELIFVRTKSLVFPDRASEPPALRRYIETLGRYLGGYDHVHFIDFAHDERMKPSYFEDEVHFTAEGKEIFTQMLADALKLIIAH